MCSTQNLDQVSYVARAGRGQTRLVSRQRLAVIVRGRFKASRREAQILGLGSALSLILSNRSEATGLESIELPPIPQPDGLKDWQARNQVVVDSAEETFQNSDLLRSLKQKSDEKRDERKRELQDKYCRRQAELGVGDCAGLRLIPGATKSGVQEKPEWLKKLVGEE